MLPFSCEWPKLHFHIRPKPKAEDWKRLGLWPNAVAKAECWNFSKLLSICLNSILFADLILTLLIHFWLLSRFSHSFIKNGSSLSSLKLKNKTYLWQNQRSNIYIYTSVAKAEGQIMKNFGFGRILWPSVDHCSLMVIISSFWVHYTSTVRWSYPSSPSCL